MEHVKEGDLTLTLAQNHQNGVVQLDSLGEEVPPHSVRNLTCVCVEDVDNVYTSSNVYGVYVIGSLSCHSYYNDFIYHKYI